METTHVTWVGLMFLPLLLIGLACFGFWLWMLVDCATNDGLHGNDKIIWVLIILFTHFIGALIYLFVARPKRLQAPSPPLSGPI
jgi:hypothetical protein